VAGKARANAAAASGIRMMSGGRWNVEKVPMGPADPILGLLSIACVLSHARDHELEHQQIHAHAYTYA